MTQQEFRSLERGQPIAREDWITKFVNAVVRELCPGLDRMTVVAAAREAWSGQPDVTPWQAAKDWVGRRAGG